MRGLIGLIAFLLSGVAGAGPVIRSQHWTDQDKPDGGVGRQRTISNYVNYQSPDGGWAASDPDVEDGDEAGDDFQQQSRRAPLQVFIGDKPDGGHTARIGMRLSHRPGHWVQFQAVNVTPDVQQVGDRPNRTVSWPNLWAYSTLKYTIGRGRVNKDIILAQAGHPASFRFALRYPAGFSHTINADGSISFLNAQGVEWLRSPPPHGWDAGGPMSGRRIRVNVVAAADIVTPRGTLPTFRIVPNATDLASAVYPVTVDPTTTISGTTNVEDALLYSLGVYVNYNWGSYTVNFVGGDNGSGYFTTVMRIATSAIPAGTLTGFRLLTTAQVRNGNGMAPVYIIKDANTWVEGTGNGSGSQTGACSWNYAKHSTQAWAGVAGCSMSGTDYDADASPPSISWGPNNPAVPSLDTWTLKPQWATDWRDAVRTNNGIILKGLDLGYYNQFNSTEAASAQPYFEVDYTPSAPASATGCSGRENRECRTALQSRSGCP